MLNQDCLNRTTGKRILHPEFTHDTPSYRQSLLDRFEEIHDAVRCEHSPAEAWIVADAILAEETAGPVVECGVFKGGLTAKLSHVCRHTGRELFVCDSFAGLPACATIGVDYEHFPERDDAFERFGPASVFEQGEYCGPIAEVMENLREHGELSVCRFVAGWFHETLPGLNVEPALVMIDVDLIESGRDCLQALWPRLKGSSFFTHEAFVKRYMDGILEPGWWRKQMQQEPPQAEGNIYGLHKHASSLARLVKEH